MEDKFGDGHAGQDEDNLGPKPTHIGFAEKKAGLKTRFPCLLELGGADEHKVLVA